ncbi:YheC/YheD family protein [Rossellomorea aquimaris]|uniref:YheC/YheD family protein n=1 Tax=Rossellomorea aquimaris TaxID=189382 RepID=UPI0007D09542|nr:YheC/YheD family protein [Rossellomorea aquimaris]
MSTSSGRWSLYEILREDIALQPFLLNTQLLKKETFSTELLDLFTIRPCFGEANIFGGSVNRDIYQLISRKQDVTFIEKSQAFHFIQEIILEGKNAILQDFHFLNEFEEKPSELYITVQLEPPSEWKVSALVEKESPSLLKGNTLLRSRMYEVAIRMAGRLQVYYPQCLTFVLEIGFVLDKLWLQDIKLHYSKSKWSQYQIMKSVQELTPYLPQTQLATPLSLCNFLSLYNEVVLKPYNGQWGAGVIKVNSLSEGDYELHENRKKTRFSNSSDLLFHLNSHYLSKKGYIVQENIPLSKIEQSPFDVRVMTQKEIPEEHWEVTGKLVKIAMDKVFVTNLAKSLIFLEDALNRIGMNMKQSIDLIAELETLCLLTSQLLEEHFSTVSIVGFDIGIDTYGQLWIIEANLWPDLTIFRMIEDKSMYEKIREKKRK